MKHKHEWNDGWNLIDSTQGLKRDYKICSCGALLFRSDVSQHKAQSIQGGLEGELSYALAQIAEMRKVVEWAEPLRRWFLGNARHSIFCEKRPAMARYQCICEHDKIRDLLLGTLAALDEGEGKAGSPPLPAP